MYGGFCECVGFGRDAGLGVEMRACFSGVAGGLMCGFGLSVCRVLEGGDQDGFGVHRDGVHRVLCEADLHPHQQHHRGHCIGTMMERGRM